MADERTIETLDAYLRDKLSGQDREAFEQQLNADPSLKQEYLFQKALVDGIRDARRMELKTTLNNIPVPSGGWGSALTAKGVTWLVVAGVTGGLLFYGLTRNQSKTEAGTQPVVEETQPAQSATDIQQSPNDSKKETASEEIKPQQPENTTAIERTLKQKTVDKPKDKMAENTDPVVRVYDPTSEINSDKEESKPAEKLTTPDRASAPSFEVETRADNKKYGFDYQFDEGKLILYGTFEKNLYEILEFFSENKRTVFLYYNQNFYLLDENNAKILPLTPITDPALLKKLRESREK